MQRWWTTGNQVHGQLTHKYPSLPAHPAGKQTHGRSWVSLGHSTHTKSLAKAKACLHMPAKFFLATSKYGSIFPGLAPYLSS